MKPLYRNKYAHDYYVQVVHQGMRSYYFSADTQEDMLGWVRALSQSAAMEPESSMNRYCVGTELIVDRSFERLNVNPSSQPHLSHL